MIAITVQYKPFGFFWKRTLETWLPARWSEMTARQIAAIPDLQSGRIDDSKLLHIFLGIKRHIAKRIDSYSKYCILRNLKYIAEPEPFGNFVIKTIVGFKAPGNQLKGVTFGAFIFGDTYYQNYLAGKKEDLNRFIACFYVNRHGFNDKNIETNAKIIGLVDIRIREAVAINYVLIREWLAMAYPYVFQKAEAGQKQEKSTGWVGVFDAVVGDDIANQEKYSEKPLSMILRFLNRKTKEYYKNGGKV
jgi:hypothetical protein